MSVLEKNSIDYIYVEDNHIIMGISDHLTWQEEAIVAHWQLLQDKLKNYIGFIKSGQLFEQYPEFHNIHLRTGDLFYIFSCRKYFLMFSKN